MKKTNITQLGLIIIILLIHIPSVLADMEIFGLELEEVLDFGSGILAIILFSLTIIAYNRTRSNKLLYVSIAFLMFALKGLLTSHELFIKEISVVDPIASILGFAILICFFLGVLRK